MLTPELLAAVLVPLVFALAVWAVAMAARAIGQSADAPSPLSVLPGARQVRAREIRQAVRHLEYHMREDAYRFERGRGSHLPPAWKTDAERRTN